MACDTVQVLAGTYNEALTIDHALTLIGANVGVAGTGARGPESLVERLAADVGPDFNITTAAPVTINGFRAQFNSTNPADQTGGVVLSVQSGNTLTFSNNIVDQSTYLNALVFDDSAAASTFQNNLFTNDHQSGSPGTGIIAPWGNTGSGTPLDVISITGNTFSHLTDTDGIPAINLNTDTGVVSGNTFEDIHQYGIILAAFLGNLSITSNLFDNIHNDTVGNQNRGSGIRTFQTPNFVGPVKVNHNTFSNDFHGVRVPNDGPPPADLSNGNFVVNRNAFTTDSSDGISVDPATVGVLDGTCNWWGSASGPSDAGPGTGTGVTTKVKFAPMLVSSNLDGFCGVAPPTIGAVSSHGTDGISVSFTPGPDGGSPFTSFTATCVSLIGQPSISATGTTSPIVVTGAISGTPYSCTVTETNAVGTSGPSGSSAVVFPAVLPGGGGGGGGSGCPVVPTAPRTPSAASETFPGAAVSWAPPLSGCIAGYIVTPYLNGVAQTPTLVPGKGTTTVIRGLTAGATYTFTVAAENGAVAGPASPMTAAVTIGAPAAASAVKAAKVGNGSLKISFVAARNNGAAVKTYTATCASSNGGKTKTKAGAKSPLTVTGLSTGHVYRCTVKATNSRGTGPQSNASAAVKA